MRPEDFVEALRERILLENRAIYSDLLEHTAPEDATDPNWRTVLSIYRQLGAEEQERLIGFIVQIITDTLSNVFAVLDGKIWLSMQEDDFILTCGESKLNGGLQDTFLAAEEENKGDLGSEGDLRSELH